MHDHIFDIVIIGGGLNGLAQALALSHINDDGLKIALIDRQEIALNENTEFDGRAFALSSSSKNMLEKLGVWQDVASKAQAMTRIKVSDSEIAAENRPILLHFDHGEVSPDSMSYMVEHKLLHNAFLKKVLDTDQINIFSGQNSQLGDVAKPLCDVHLSTYEHTLKARLVIAADGKNSPSREHAGINTYGWSYDQTGIVTNVAHEKPHYGVAEEHFLPGGPFAILPLSGNRASLVWTEEKDEAKRVMALNEADFEQEISKRFGDHLGEIELITGRWAFPLSLYLAEEYYKGRVVLIGDSAHLVHPIAGLGLNLGLRDVAALTDVIRQALLIGSDIGAENVLERYQKWRRFDNVFTGLACDGLNRLFSNDHSSLKEIRGLGLKAVNQLEPLKNLFMHEASGMAGEVPSLMQK